VYNSETSEIAVIHDPRFGMVDGFSEPCLYFHVTIPEGVSAYLVIPYEHAKKLFQDSQVSDVHLLEGKLCWVQRKENSIRFLRYCKA